jgi:hypothetical protein
MAEVSTEAPSLPPTRPFSTEDLLALIHNEDWEAVDHWIPRIASLPKDTDLLEPHYLVLTTLCRNPHAPIHLYRHILSYMDPASISDQDDTFVRTPLHHLMEHSHRPDVLSVLLQAAPTSIHVTDLEGLRPIDIVTQTILMWEERQKYQNHVNNSDNDTIHNGDTENEINYEEHEHRRTRSASSPLPFTTATTSTSTSNSDIDSQHNDQNNNHNIHIHHREHDCWECVRRILVAHAQQAHASVSYNLDLPHVHACLASPDIPYALKDRVLRLYGPRSWLQCIPPHGTPLHWIAAECMDTTNKNGSTTLSTAINGNNSMNATSSITASSVSHHASRPFHNDDEWLLPVLHACPAAAAVRNDHGALPLDVAVAAGRTWSTGCRELLEAYPAALNKYQAQWSVLVPLLVQRKCTTIVWVLLTSHPNWVHQSRPPPNGDT